jgi:hypothetical protein
MDKRDRTCRVMLITNVDPCTLPGVEKSIFESLGHGAEQEEKAKA